MDERKEASGAAHVCWNCQKIAIAASLIIGKSRVLINRDTKLYAHHITGNFDMNTVVGTISVNPNNPNLWGVRNETAEMWTYLKVDGTEMPIAKGRSAAIVPNARINFGQTIGVFKLG